MKVAFKLACGWNSAACFPAATRSSLAESRVFWPMASMDTLGVAESKTGRVAMMRPARGTCQSVAHVSMRTAVLLGCGDRSWV